MAKTYREVLIPTIEKLSPGVVRIVFSIAEYEMAALYFEQPKKGWTNKPIMPNKWTCVDAQITDKHIYINGLVEPKDLVGWGQELILSSQ